MQQKNHPKSVETQFSSAVMVSHLKYKLTRRVGIWWLITMSRDGKVPILQPGQLTLQSSLIRYLVTLCTLVIFAT